MNRFANVMALASSMAHGRGASVGAPGFPAMPQGMPAGMPQGMQQAMAMQQMQAMQMQRQGSGASVGDNNSCNIGPAMWPSYPSPCAPGADYGIGGYGLAVGQDAGAMAATGAVPGVPGYGYPGSCDFPWQFYCALQAKRRGPICTTFGLGETEVPALQARTINIPVQNPMRTKCLVIPSDVAGAFMIDGIFVNGVNQLSGGSVPASIFSELAEGCANNFESDLIGAFNGQLTITVRNITNAPETFKGAFGVVQIIC